MDIVKERLGAPEGNGGEHPAGLRNTFKRLVGRGQEAEKKGLERKTSKGYTEQYVTDQGKIIEVPCMYALMMYTPLSSLRLTISHSLNISSLLQSPPSNPSWGKPPRNCLPRHFHRHGQ